MVIARYTQSPGEVKNYQLDYTQWLSVGETISNTTAEISPVSVPPLGVVATIDPTLLSVSALVSGGLESNDYTVKIITTTSGGQIKEDCIEFTVENSCG